MPLPGWPPVPGSPSAAVGRARRPGVVIWLLPFRWMVAAGVAGIDMAGVGSAGPDSVRHDGIGLFRSLPGPYPPPTSISRFTAPLRLAHIGFFRLGRPIGLTAGRVVRGRTRIQWRRSGI